MSDEFRKGVGKNKYLLSASVLLIVAGLVLGSFGKPEGDVSGSEEPRALSQVINPDSPMADALNENFVEPTVLSAPEEKSSVVDEIESTIGSLDDGPELERALSRVANLYYSSVRNYEKAVFYYDRLISEYPEGRHVRTAYVNLADGYSRLNKVEQEIATYYAILEAFPEGDSMREWAQGQLDEE